MPTKPKLGKSKSVGADSLERTISGYTVGAAASQGALRWRQAAQAALSKAASFPSAQLSRPASGHDDSEEGGAEPEV